MSRYYADYECRADNAHGSASWLVSLRVATPPGPIRQVVLEKVTATTIMFKFVPPQSSGGLKITSYIAEYKDTKQSWEEARKRYWFQQTEGTFELGNLQPWKSYDIRFGCSNPVGVSGWAEQLQITLPQPSPPHRPVLFLNGENVEETELEGSANSSLELSWDRPETNGAPIDFYRVEEAVLETNRTNVTLVSSDGQRVCRLGETNEIYLSANNDLRLASRDTFIYELCSV